MTKKDKQKMDEYTIRFQEIAKKKGYSYVDACSRFWNKWNDKKQCLEAVKEDGSALRFVKEQDKQICLETVKKVGIALQFVKEQDKEICLQAVKNDGYALQFVKEQDKEICLEALKNNSNALRYVRDETLFFELVDIINKKEW